MGKPRTLATAAVIVLVVPGCSGQGEGVTGPPSSRPTFSASSPSPVEQARGAALAAYRGMWRAVVTASAIPDADHPDLPRYAAGNALALLRQGLEADEARDVVAKGQPAFTPKITKVTDDAREVRIADCSDGTKWLRYERSGELVNDEPGGRHKVRATVTRSGEGWRVTRLRVWETGSC